MLTPLHYAAAAVLAAALAWGGWERMQRLSIERDVAQQQAKWQAERAELQQQARDAERSAQEQVQVIAERFEWERRDAEKQAAELAADLRAGRERFRLRWQGCENAAARVPASSDSSGQPDDTADDRIESASRAVRAARECDAQVRGLQELIRSWTTTSSTSSRSAQ